LPCHPNILSFLHDLCNLWFVGRPTAQSLISTTRHGREDGDDIPLTEHRRWIGGAPIDQDDGGPYARNLESLEHLRHWGAVRNLNMADVALTVGR
jgi:hypothetical protein